MKIIGHRGARNEAPENTIEGFLHASRNGCRHFELDIQLSADYQLIVYHDKNLKRTSGIPNKVKHSTSTFLNKTDARMSTPGWHSPCYIPNLQDVVDSVPNTLSWQFEIKTDARHAQKIIIRKLFELFKSHELYEKATITSAHRWLLWEIKRLNPNIKTGYVAEWRYNRPIKTAARLQCDLLVLNHRLASPTMIKRARKQGLEISCWTVNDMERAAKLKHLGIDSLITDTPSSAIKLLKD